MGQVKGRRLRPPIAFCRRSHGKDRAELRRRRELADRD
jgi:hypothetical protein